MKIAQEYGRTLIPSVRARDRVAQSIGLWNRYRKDLKLEVMEYLRLPLHLIAAVLPHVYISGTEKCKVYESLRMQRARRTLQHAAALHSERAQRCSLSPGHRSVSRAPSANTHRLKGPEPLSSNP